MIKIHDLSNMIPRPEHGSHGRLLPTFDSDITLYTRVSCYKEIREVPIQYRDTINYMIENNIPTLHTGDIVYTISENLS